MANHLFLIILASSLFALLLRVYYLYTCNIKAAKRSGFPIVSLPINQAHPLWLVTNRLFLPWIRLLPRSWTHPWIIFLQPDFVWYGKRELFMQCGGDILLLVSPFHMQLCVGNPDAIDQISTRTTEFPKDLRMYDRLALFGPNIVTADGRLWRYHRKLISPSFGEKAIAVVWKESIDQARAMVDGWTKKEAQRKDPQEPGTVLTSMEDFTTLSLHIIARASFGTQLRWPHEDQIPIPKGHNMSYKRALELVLDNIGIILVMPQWLLSRFPAKLVRETGEAFSEWTKYQREMYVHKMQDLKSGAMPSEATPSGQNIVESLIEGQETLSEEEILSNIFVLMLAGHETTANAMFFSTLMLAMHPKSQERLQEELDGIFRDLPAEQWDFKHSRSLHDGMCAAVVNEILRLIPPILAIPKTTHRDVDLELNGTSYTVPCGVNVMLNPSIAGSNPDYWPNVGEGDLNRFRPERWLLDPTDDKSIVVNDTTHSNQSRPHPKDGTLDDADDTQPEPVTSAALFRPAKGAYIPFSEGQRSCIGRRFAQVEAHAVLAYIMKHWSVELDVSMWMSEEELHKASDDEKRQVWAEAKARADDLLGNGMWTIISLQMRAGRVPLKFVRRGHEVFRGVVEG